MTFAGRAVAVLLTPFLGSRPPDPHWGHRGSAQELQGGGLMYPSRRVPRDRCEDRRLRRGACPSITPVVGRER